MRVQPHIGPSDVTRSEVEHSAKREPDVPNRGIVRRCYPTAINRLWLGLPSNHRETPGVAVRGIPWTAASSVNVENACLRSSVLMPTYARCQIVAEGCGIDCYTGQDFSDRKEWILDRVRELAGLFAVEGIAKHHRRQQ
jgi:hypothetical protein